MPSVAKTSTLERRAGRARARRCRLGSRLTAGLAPGASSDSGRAVRSRQRGEPWVPGRSRRRAHRFGPSIPPDMAYSGGPSTRVTRSPVTLAPWDYLFVSFNSAELPGHLPPDLDRLAGPAGRPDHPVQRPDPGAPPPRRLPRDVGVAVVDRPDHVQPADHRVALRVRLLPRPADRDHRPRRRWSGSASSASRRSSRRTSSASPASATSRSRSTPTPRRRSRSAAPADAGRSASGADAASAIAACRSRSAGSGSGTGARTARPASVGLTGQVLHSDGRGDVSELAFARGTRGSSRTPTRTRTCSSSSRAAAGSASATSGPGSRPARRPSGRRTSRTRPGPSTRRCARSSSSSPAPTIATRSRVAPATPSGRRRAAGRSSRGTGQLTRQNGPTAGRPAASNEGEPALGRPRTGARGSAVEFAPAVRARSTNVVDLVGGRQTAVLARDVEDVAQVAGRRVATRRGGPPRSPRRWHRDGRCGSAAPKRSARSLGRSSGVPATIRATRPVPSSAAGPSRARRPATAPRGGSGRTARSPNDRPRSPRHPRSDRGTGRRGRRGSRSRSAGRSATAAGSNSTWTLASRATDWSVPVRSSVNSRRASARSLT